MDDRYELQVSLPLDTDGFLRRECPRCSRQFKWHYGPANEEAENHARPPAYHCPLCGQPATDGSWNTPAQVELMERAVGPAAIELIQDELEAMFKGVKGFKYQRGRSSSPDLAVPLVEADDMSIVTSPCHDFEPVKVPEDHTGPLYCLICGAAFAV